MSASDKANAQPRDALDDIVVMSREEAQEHERSVREQAKDNPVLAGALTRLGRVREAEVETEEHVEKPKADALPSAPPPPPAASPATLSNEVAPPKPKRDTRPEHIEPVAYKTGPSLRKIAEQIYPPLNPADRPKTSKRGAALWIVLGFVGIVVLGLSAFVVSRSGDAAGEPSATVNPSGSVVATATATATVVPSAMATASVGASGSPSTSEPDSAKTNEPSARPHPAKATVSSAPAKSTNSEKTANPPVTTTEPRTSVTAPLPQVSSPGLPSWDPEQINKKKRP